MSDIAERPPVSDEIAEVVARAMYIACHPARGAMGWEWCQERTEWLRDARAAISDLSALGIGDVAKARAEGREEAAKVAENFPAHTHGALATAPAYAAEQAADEIAAAIRAMNSKKPAAG